MSVRLFKTHGRIWGRGGPASSPLLAHSLGQVGCFFFFFFKVSHKMYVWVTKQNFVIAPPPPPKIHYWSGNPSPISFAKVEQFQRKILTLSSWEFRAVIFCLGMIRILTWNNKHNCVTEWNSSCLQQLTIYSYTWSSKDRPPVEKSIILTPLSVLI